MAHCLIAFTRGMKLGTKLGAYLRGVMKSLLSILLAFSFQALAQDYRQGSDLERYRQPIVTETKVGTLATDPYIQKMSGKITAELDQKFQTLLSGLNVSASDCSDPTATLKKVRALRVAGKLEACMSLARTCQARPEGQLALLEGAACAHHMVKTQEAYELMDMATEAKMSSSPYQDLAVYRFALLARNTQYEKEVPQILSRHTKWNAQEVKEIMAVLTLINNGHVDDMSETLVQQKMNSLAAKNSDWANEMAIAWLTHLVVNKYDRIGGLKYLETAFQNVYEVDRIYKYIFQAFYHTPGENFKFSKDSLEVYYKYSNEFSWYPVEQNVYTVGEVYNKVCGQTLAKGAAAAELKAIKASWLNGEKPEQILPKVEDLDSRVPGKADILTLKASLLGSLDREDEAFEIYWKAHQVCRYYHRGHWGLWGIKKNRFYKGLKDYSEIRQRVSEEVARSVFSPGIEKYVMNWSMLTPSQAEGVKHAIKLWGPFIDGLVAAGTQLYIKYDFEYHSEIPGYETDRDQRAWAPDNRSLDELRGRGGNPVVSDIGETMRSPHGDYNLGAHEIAHSWHLDYLPAVRRNDLQTCITKLYTAAGKRGKYADSYAASHENEYFAQSVGYYLIPIGAPARYGLTVEWMMKNDSDMFEFIKRIESSGGDISKVRCPI